MSFNNFLSIAPDRKLSVFFAVYAQCDPNLIGIPFQITINSSTSTILFANTSHVSYFGDEKEEILFSVNSIRCIGSIKPIDENKRLCQINLTLTSENDPELHVLTEHMRQDIYAHGDGRDRLDRLLIKLRQFQGAQEA
ncbi:unnamed protein product [Rotaria socialis]